MSNNTRVPNPIRKLEMVRLSFPALFTAERMDGDDPTKKPKYAATFLLDKKANAKDIAGLQADIEFVKKNSEKLKGKKVLKSPIREGSDKDHLDGYSADNVFIAARSESRPGVVDRLAHPLVEEDGRPYAGCYVNARVECYGYVHPKSGPGITFGLLNVQFVRDGEPFGGKASAPDEGMTALPEDDGQVDQGV